VRLTTRRRWCSLTTCSFSSTTSSSGVTAVLAARRREPTLLDGKVLGDGAAAVPSRVEVSGLLDTGAAVNVLPYASGVALGFDWDRQTTSVRLGRNLAAVEARAVTVSAIVGSFAPVRLVFAWTHADDVPIRLGQVNFFAEFDVCFFRSRGIFELRPAQRP
jgi:hypothetical protein